MDNGKGGVEKQYLIRKTYRMKCLIKVSKQNNVERKKLNLNIIYEEFQGKPTTHRALIVLTSDYDYK